MRPPSDSTSCCQQRTITRRESHVSFTGTRLETAASMGREMSLKPHTSFAPGILMQWQYILRLQYHTEPDLASRIRRPRIQGHTANFRITIWSHLSNQEDCIALLVVSSYQPVHAGTPTHGYVTDMLATARGATVRTSQPASQMQSVISRTHVKSARDPYSSILRFQH